MFGLKKKHAQSNEFHCTAIVAAAGNSNRMGMNKLLMELDGIPVLARTLINLQNCDDVHEIVIVCRSQDIVVYSDIAVTYNITKLKKVVCGGANRAKSVELGLYEASRDTSLAAVHDAARPLATPALMSSVIRLAAHTNAAIPAVHVKDTLKIIENGIVSTTPKRDTLYAAQTPQVFDIDLLKGALKKACDDDSAPTDDASAVEALGISVYTVMGDYDNIKITTPEDIELGESILHRISGEI